MIGLSCVGLGGGGRARQGRKTAARLMMCLCWCAYDARLLIPLGVATGKLVDFEVGPGGTGTWGGGQGRKIAARLMINVPAIGACTAFQPRFVSVQNLRMGCAE